MLLFCLPTCKSGTLFSSAFCCSPFSTHLQCGGYLMLLFVCAKSNQKRTGGCRPYGYPALTRLPHSKPYALQLRQTRRRINSRILGLYKAHVCTSIFSAAFRFFLSLYALAVQGLFHVTFLLAQKSNQKSALKNYVLKNLLNVPLQKSRGTCAKRNVTTFDMVRFTSRKVVSFDTVNMALSWLR